MKREEDMSKKEYRYGVYEWCDMCNMCGARYGGVKSCVTCMRMTLAGLWDIKKPRHFVSEC